MCVCNQVTTNYGPTVIVFDRHAAVLFQDDKLFRAKHYGVSKALTSLQTNTESFGLLLLQAYIIVHTWTSYYSIPIGGLANVGERPLSPFAIQTAILLLIS